MPEIDYIPDDECDKSSSGHHSFEDGECIYCGVTTEDYDEDDESDDD